MPQLSFQQNYNHMPSFSNAISQGTLSFIPFNIDDSISFKTLNVGMEVTLSSLGNISFTLSLGLYSLTGNSVSLANSISLSRSSNNGLGATTSQLYISATATSATQNITPGTWFWGIVGTSNASLLGDAAWSLYIGSLTNAGNAFPGGFIGGRMTASTNALPESYATSDLDITGNDAMGVPYILLSS